MAELAVRVVLVRARNPLNIGAAARAMANFGLSDLVLVDPYDEAWRTARSARAGAEVLQQARTVPTLIEALSGCHYVVGTTDGATRVPRLPLEDWEAVVASLPGGPPFRGVAVVFGSEKTGMSVEDISQCNRLATIPTVPSAPSMNLGQAVALCAYELARASRTLPAPRSETAVLSATGRERVLETWYPLLEQIEAVHVNHRTSQMRALREMLVRWRLTARDERRLLGMARQLRHALTLADRRH